MTIKIKLAQLIDSAQVTGELDSLRFKGSYHASRLVEKVDAEAKRFDAERLKICKEFGTPSADGKGYNFTVGEKQDGFSQAYKDLCESEVVVEITKLKASELAVASSVTTDKDGKVVVNTDGPSTALYRVLAWAIEE